MSDESDRPVLILDDDQFFRQLVGTLLEGHGYRVIQARSPKDAGAILQKCEPSLAIVDYRLGEGDGISWITWLRESGKNLPVVFISGSWCDERTFNWLRNILKVSLILQKPIVPELFFQQIEGLLPPPPGYQFSMPAEPLAVYHAKPSAKPVDIEAELEEVSRLLDSGIEDPVLIDQLHDKILRLEMQMKLAEAKTGYVAELQQEWKGLSEGVALAQADPYNGAALSEAVSLAHKIRGTSGSLGFERVSQDAEKIENMLRQLDPTGTLTELIWTEVFRALADGETAINHELGITSTTIALLPVKGSVLLLGNADLLGPWARMLREELSLDASVCDSIAAALGRCKRTQFDALVLDTAFDDTDRILALASEIRALAGNRVIPAAFILPQGTRLTRSQLAYAGSSATLDDPLQEEQLLPALKRMCRIQEEQKLKVLTVDDDPVLTRFISSILSANGLAVRELNKPIQILEVMHDYRPDLVILDVIMPGLSGYDVCRMLRASEEHRAVPIVFLTSKSDREGRQAAFQAGADDFLSKPVLGEELTARVLGQLERLTVRKNQVPAEMATGLLNRADFLQRATSLLDECRRTSMRMTFALLSIDDFANMGIMHSLYGSEQALETLGQLLCCHFKAEDLRGRWSDGGFALATPGEARETMAEAIERMLLEFADMRLVSSTVGSFKATFSAGLADHPGDGDSVEALVNTAYMRLVRGRQQKLGSIAFVT